MRDPDLVAVAKTGRPTVNPLVLISDTAARRLATLAGKLRLLPNARISKKRAATMGRNSSPTRPWLFTGG